MDALFLFALSFATIVVANNAALAQHYAAHAQYAYPVEGQLAWEAVPAAYPPLTPHPAPVPGWIAGAAVGSHVGAMVSASNPMIQCGRRACSVGYDPRPVIAGALIGGLIGHAASMPPAYQALPADVAPPRRSSASSSDSIVDHWQNFMEPSVSRSAERSPLPGFSR